MSASSTNVPSSSNNTQAQQTQQDHDARGRWTKGNKGGPGSPFNRRVASLRRLLLEQVSAADLAAIVAKIVEKAKEGDLAAARLVLAYTVGKPTAAVDPDRVDVEEFNLLCEEAVPAEVLTVPLAGIPASLACDIMTAALPEVTAAKAEQVRDALLDFAQPAEQAERAAPVDSTPTPQQPEQPSRRSGESKQASKPRQRKAKTSKDNPSTDSTSAAQTIPEGELPSVEQIRALAQRLCAASPGTSDLAARQRPAATGGQPATVSKREQTVNRAANPDHFPD